MSTGAPRKRYRHRLPADDELSDKAADRAAAELDLAALEAARPGCTRELRETAADALAEAAFEGSDARDSRATLDALARLDDALKAAEGVFLPVDLARLFLAARGAARRHAAYLRLRASWRPPLGRRPSKRRAEVVKLARGLGLSRDAADRVASYLLQTAPARARRKGR